MKKSLVGLAAFILPLVAGCAHAHSSPLNKAAMEVCKEKKRSQVCQYEGHHDDLYIGTCQYASDENLICVRNKPVQKIDSDKEKSEGAHKN